MACLLAVIFLSLGCQPSAQEVTTEETATPETPSATEVTQEAPSGGEFNWKAYAGEELKLLLNKHPYTDALLAELDKFTELTGIKVTYDIYPEDEYFDKVTIALSARTPEYDAFMTGAYQVWQYAPAGYMEDLRAYINDPSKTNPDYDFGDIYPNLSASDSWDLVPGHELGTGDAGQWAIPWGFETNALMYNMEVFEQAGITEPPQDIPALIEAGKKIQEKTDKYGVAVRGTRSWATIHPGFLSAYIQYGAKDYVVDEDGSLTPAMNSPEAVQMTKDWVKMVKEVGPRAWTNYIWYEVGTDLGQEKAGMIYDADILGYFQNQPGASPAAGKIAWALPPGPPGGKNDRANIWIWSLSMNAASDNKDAAWYFLQWATGKDFQTTGALKYNLVDPVRKSIWDNPEFIDKLKTNEGYYETFKGIIENSKVYFTPQPLFFETTTEWAAALHEIYNGADAQKVLDDLVKRLDSELEAAGIP